MLNERDMTFDQSLNGSKKFIIAGGEEQSPTLFNMSKLNKTSPPKTLLKHY